MSSPSTLLNFAYGSNMSSRYLREVCPGAKAVRTAVLPNMQMEAERVSHFATFPAPHRGTMKQSCPRV